MVCLLRDHAAAYPFGTEFRRLNDRAETLDWIAGEHDGELERPAPDGALSFQG